MAEDEMREVLMCIELEVGHVMKHLEHDLPVAAYGYAKSAQRIVQNALYETLGRHDSRGTPFAVIRVDQQQDP